MTLTLLFDLDDTLLDTHLETFIPAYFQALSSHLSKYVSPDAMLSALLEGWRLMAESEDPTRTLREVFDSTFYPQLGIPKEELSEPLEQFYADIFPTIGTHTKQRPEATPLIEWAASKGYRLAIATDPLFPREATYHRLRWAGFEPGQFELISTFENFHFSKTQPTYYAEMLGQLGWPDGPILMVGNDMKRDIFPAHRLGLKSYLIDGDSASGSGPEARQGKLVDLRPWLESIDLTALEPSLKTPEAIFAIMLSTPAVLRSLTNGLSEDDWRHVSTKDDWAMTEIVCHLRDTEREVHHVQLRLMLEQAGAFIPRPETAVWASERDYLHLDGAIALDEFVSARIATLDMLKKLDDDIWSRQARHAIFGPTNFLEVVLFMADHDRMHIQQVRKTLMGL